MWPLYKVSGHLGLHSTSLSQKNKQSYKSIEMEEQEGEKHAVNTLTKEITQERFQEQQKFTEKVGKKQTYIQCTYNGQRFISLEGSEYFYLYVTNSIASINKKQKFTKLQREKTAWIVNVPVSRAKSG